MRRIIYIIALFVSISCTEIGVIEEDIPYEDKYVVYGRLQGGTDNVNINFSNTYRLDENTSIEDAALKNLTPYLWSESQGIFPLIYQSEGNYLPLDNLDIKYGKQYELHVKIGSERLYANTVIPNIPELEEIELVDDYLVCKLIPEEKVVFGVKYNITSYLDQSGNFKENVFFEISEPGVALQEFVSVRTGSLPAEYLRNVQEYRLDLQIYAFDEDYSAYYSSRLNNKPVENIFSEGGGSVFWNVQGKDVIGMFIGYTIKTENDVKLD